jgi:hypothetical protein
LIDRVLAWHQPRTTTLAILNTVERARGLFVELESRCAELADAEPIQGSADFRIGGAEIRAERTRASSAGTFAVASDGKRTLSLRP